MARLIRSPRRPARQLPCAGAGGASVAPASDKRSSTLRSALGCDRGVEALGRINEKRAAKWLTVGPPPKREPPRQQARAPRGPNVTSYEPSSVKSLDVGAQLGRHDDGASFVMSLPRDGPCVSRPDSTLAEPVATSYPYRPGWRGTGSCVRTGRTVQPERGTAPSNTRFHRSGTRRSDGTSPPRVMFRPSVA